jgi:hypothetical protein
MLDKTSQQPAKLWSEKNFKNFWIQKSMGKSHRLGMERWVKNFSDQSNEPVDKFELIPGQDSNSLT